MVLHKTRVIKLDKREKMDPLTQQNPVNVTFNWADLSVIATIQSLKNSFQVTVKDKLEEGPGLLTLKKELKP